MDNKAQVPGYAVLVLGALVVILIVYSYMSSTETPHFTKVDAETQFVVEGYSFKVFYKIKNTEKVTLTPRVEVVFDSECLGGEEEKILDPIEPNTERGFFTEFSTYENSDCVDVKGIMFILSDSNSNELLDRKETKIEIIRS